MLHRIIAWAIWIVAATLSFSEPLIGLMLHAVRSELLSYIPLVPFVSGYLLYTRKGAPDAVHRTSLGGAAALGGVGVLAIAAAMWWADCLSINDDLALRTLAYVAVVAAGGFLFLGARWMSAAAFPITFLIFMVPLPDAIVHGLETASVLGSAEVSAFLFTITGTPMLRDGTEFMLPGIVLKIAQECSGIHSTWVLFITSLVASHLFLGSRWRRIIMVAFVIPLAIIRNGFRILVIGLLCVHVGPQMIDSVIHRRGGPLFFILSLLPLFSLLWWLRRRDR